MFSSRANDLARSKRALSSTSEGAVALVMFFPDEQRPWKYCSYMKRPTSSNLIFNEENRDRFNKISEFARKALHYGWIPLIMIIGMSNILFMHLIELVGYIRSDPRPSLLRILNPLS